MQPFDAGGACVGGEAIHQDRPDPAALPLSATSTATSAVAPSRTRRAMPIGSQLDQRDEHVVVSVHAREQLEITRREHVLRAAEAQVP